VDEPVALQAKFVLEKRLARRHQVEVAIPIGVQQVEETDGDGSTSLRWGEGFGDLALAYKGVLWHSLRAGTIGSFGSEVFFPVGDERDGLSKGTFVFEPFLAVGQIIPGDNHLQLHAGAEISADDDMAAHELFWRGAVGHTFTQGRFGRAWSPMVEILGTKELVSDEVALWAVVPELHLTLNQRQHVMMVLGSEIPINHFDERQVTVMLSLLWDWFDGGLAEGW
jgi:hypothetical protein